MTLDPMHPAVVNGLELINTLHAEFLNEMSGEATPEERDTWNGKIAAARFVLVASDQQIIDELTTLGGGGAAAIAGKHELLLLSGDVGNDPIAIRALAVEILGKSLISHFASGKAAGMRRLGRAAIQSAPSEDAIRAIINGMEEQIDAAKAEIAATMAALSGGGS